MTGNDPKPTDPSAAKDVASASDQLTTVNLQTPSADDQNNAGSEQVLWPGTLIAGRYQVLDQIGRGGMGEVYRVVQIFLDEIYALKILTAVDSASFMRFQREARVTHKLDHKNLVAVTDSGVLDSGVPFLVMKFVEGSPLSQEIKVRGLIPWRQALDIFIEICDGLAFAHRQGIVHRDLKPSNFMIGKSSVLDSGAGAEDCKPSDEGKTTDSPQVKIIDFGIARFVGNEGFGAQGLTRTGDLIGSPLFMSPEQCSGKQVDHRSDIYSLGCALFQALTGVPPFSAENALTTMIMHQTVSPPPLKDLIPQDKADFPVGLEKVVSMLLAKDPADRYQAVEELQKDLLAIRKGESTSTARSRASMPLKWVVALWLIASLAVLAVAMTVSQASKPKEMPLAKPDMMRNTFDLKEYQQKVDAPSSHFAARTLAEAVKQGGPRIFRFPSEPIGQIGTSSSDLQLAQGTVIIKEAKPLVFFASPTIATQPNLFLGFRPEELWRLEFNLIMFGPPVKDDVAYCISKLTDIRDLKIPESDMTDKGFAYLNNLAELESLNINLSRQITGKGLGSAKWIRQLVALRASGLKGDFKPVVNALAGSPRIRSIDFRYDGLNDEDVAKLTTCPNLNQIELAGCPEITDRSITYMLRLKKLKLLNIRHCGVTPEGVMSLAALKHLRELFVMDKHWSKKQFEAFRKAMPNCNVSVFGPGDPAKEYQ